MAVGNFRDAMRAVNKELKLIGEGSSRIGYLDDDDSVVYKVTRYDTEINEVEYETMVELRELGFPYILPVSLWDVDNAKVLAIPYIKEDVSNRAKAGARFWAEVSEFFSSDKVMDDLLWDTGSSSNLRVDEDGNCFITDLQWIADYDRVSR